ncbi:hypothetical protein [Alicyclobacillus ferrooxydans]|uniref:Uncharacterized protein n=1 Tax=Alicyclobacillus ferrooxydans TaxID=471514 RepID=A0A0P9GNC9_9BACL|nr:hypothetical protein [Alicyclobacillus ferrooxydans]KPV41978.1 hypothetical protein AN477_19575 [Alicyclobacillus ferrooxydans]
MKVTWIGIVRTIIPVGLLLLGINGLVEVRLQKDMAAKTITLTKQVSQAKSLSGQLGEGLGGLTELQKTTESMQATLVQVQTASANMASGLASLSQTVTGINQSVSTIKTGVGQSQSDIQSISASELHILSTLGQLNQINGSVVNNLGVMLADEDSIRQDLVQMNQKTALIP